MIEPSVFTRIINGELPCHKVYEDAKTLAFMDIHPPNPGQVLVVPKAQVQFIWDITPADYQALMGTVQKVGRRIREVLGAKFVGIHVEGIQVPHAHVRVFPFANGADFYKIADQSVEPDHTTLAEMAKKLAFKD